MWMWWDCDSVPRATRPSATYNNCISPFLTLPWIKKMIQLTWWLTRNQQTKTSLLCIRSRYIPIKKIQKAIDFVKIFKHFPPIELTCKHTWIYFHSHHSHRIQISCIFWVDCQILTETLELHRVLLLEVVNIYQPLQLKRKNWMSREKENKISMRAILARIEMWITKAQMCVIKETNHKTKNLI